MPFPPAFPHNLTFILLLLYIFFFFIIVFFFPGIGLKHPCEKMPFLLFYFCTKCFPPLFLSLSLSFFFSFFLVSYFFLLLLLCIGGTHPVICLRISFATTLISFSFAFFFPFSFYFYGNLSRSRRIQPRSTWIIVSDLFSSSSRSKFLNRTAHIRNRHICNLKLI